MGAHRCRIQSRESPIRSDFTPRAAHHHRRQTFYLDSRSTECMLDVAGYENHARKFPTVQVQSVHLRFFQICMLYFL